MNNLSFVLNVLLLVGIFIFILYVISMLVEYDCWFKAKNSDCIELDFSMFISLYHRAPDKFDIDGYGIVYKRDGYNDLVVALSGIIDYIKYKRWYINHERILMKNSIRDNTHEAIDEIIDM